MAQQTINIGSAPNDGTGDTIRVGGDKINDNFTELYAVAAGLGTASALDVDTDGTLAANSDALVASQKAVRTYVSTAVTGLLEFKGSTDCSANPNYPAGLKGDAYLVTVAGKIGGASGEAVDAGDVYIASADNAGGTEASVGTSWFVIEHNGVFGAAYTDEQVRDAIGTALTDTGLVVVTPNDGGDTIDINVPAAAGSDFRTGTDATKALTSDACWDAADYVTLNDSGGNVAVDLSTGLNFKMTMDGDYTLSAPSNGKPGQTGVIVLTQDGTGTQTLAYNAVWKFAGGTDPVLSTAASTVDLLFYQVLPNGTDVYATLVKAIA